MALTPLLATQGPASCRPNPHDAPEFDYILDFAGFSGVLSNTKPQHLAISCQEVYGIRLFPAELRAPAHRDDMVFFGLPELQIRQVR
jgi:hypothetical protein